MTSRHCSTFLAIIFASTSLSTAVAQRVYTKEDYAQAERWMPYNVNILVHHTIHGVEYLSDGRVFYRDPGTGGNDAYMIADPVKAAVTPAFDNVKLAAALNRATKASPDQQILAGKLGVTAYKSEANGGFAVTIAAGEFHCDAAVTTCTPEPKPPTGEKIPEKTVGKPAAQPVLVTQHRAGADNLSPDKKLAAFIRDNNLWVRTVATGQERQLTTDGVEDFGYATDNAGWQHSDAAILTWSADGKKIATFQQDQRKTGFMYLVPVTDRHPVLEAWRYPLVGDKDVTMIEPVIIDVATAKVVRLKTPPLEHRSMECDDVSCDGDGRWSDVTFSPDDTHLAFVATSRDHKDEWVRMADTATGDVRDIYHERVVANIERADVRNVYSDPSDTYYGWQSKTDWKVLWNANEFLWVSERSNWAQIYLYDLKTGQLKNQVTDGNGPVSDLKYVDEKNRVIYFTAKGKEETKNPTEDPYFDNYYRVDFDGKNQRLLTPEVADHVVTPSGDGRTFVDVYSTVNTPQIAVLRDNTGKVLVTLAKQDISQLLAQGWKPPMPIKANARDGFIQVYGFLWKPTNFDATKKYPVVDYIYPGPQQGSCGSRSFSAAHGDNQSLADLGFIVVCIDGTGTPGRSKSFHDANASSPQNMDDGTIADQSSAITDLASRYPWMDVNHVGIWGHSGGGMATVAAMFNFSNFFSVGWAESGDYDQREYEDDWDERWAGLEVIGPNGEDNYAAQALQGYAKNLKGHLMLTYGTMDDNVPPNNTLLVVDALIKANKDFDMLSIPNAHHGYAAAEPYVMKRRWDYFVKYLAGGIPAMDFQPESYEEIMKAYSEAQ